MSTLYTTVEPLKTDSPYYGNLHNADKSPLSWIIPYTIVYVRKENLRIKDTSEIRTLLQGPGGVLISEVPLYMKTIYTALFSYKGNYPNVFQEDTCYFMFKKCLVPTYPSHPTHTQASKHFCKMKPSMHVQTVWPTRVDFAKPRNGCQCACL